MGQFDALEAGCKKTNEHFKKDLGRLRTGRAATSMLEGINVDYYGSHVPLIQLGLISAPEPRLLTIQVYDSGAVESVEKAIMQSELGLTPNRDGALIRINIPALTEERRKELIKKLHKMGEEAKVALRNNRREALDALKKVEKAEDAVKRGETEIQKIIDKYQKDIDSLVALKEKEILEK